MLGRTGTALVISVAALGTAWSVSAGAPAQPSRARGSLVARTHPPVPVTSVLAGTPQAIAAGVALDLFAFAPIVVTTSASQSADLASAIGQASRAHAPLLLTSAQAGTGG